MTDDLDAYELSRELADYMVRLQELSNRYFDAATSPALSSEPEGSPECVEAEREVVRLILQTRAVVLDFAVFLERGSREFDKLTVLEDPEEGGMS